MIRKSLLCIYSFTHSFIITIIIPHSFYKIIFRLYNLYYHFVGSFDLIIPRDVSAPQMRFLREHLEKAGCHVADNFIKAIKCDKAGIAGGYTKGEGVLVSFSLITLSFYIFISGKNLGTVT